MPEGARRGPSPVRIYPTSSSSVHADAANDGPKQVRPPTLSRALGCALAALALVLAVIGLLVVTRGTPVEGVRSLDEGGGPGVRETAFVPIV